MTNAEFYKDSHILANWCFNCWCEGMLERDDPWCVDPTSCEICHARWYTLEFDQSAHDEAMRRLKEERGEDGYKRLTESNAESEARYRELNAKIEESRKEIAREHGWPTYAECKAHNFEHRRNFGREDTFVPQRKPAAPRKDAPKRVKKAVSAPKEGSVKGEEFVITPRERPRRALKPVTESFSSGTQERRVTHPDASQGHCEASGGQE